MKLSSSKDYFDGIMSGNRTILAKAISLVESKNPTHQKMARELIKLILPETGKSKRIGISGIPGVGKSTFIENFGMHLISRGQRIAVLAVDPTSQKTGGSILGDKTRMANLSSEENAFIRPSPSGETLGGITAKTREAILLCDAFGFDVIFVETVGVGQSEISVSYLTDMFLLLMQPGAGDELQGIKRGILEVSDLVLINKADGENEKLAKVSQHDYSKSLDVLQHDKQTKVLLCSSLHKKGFDEIEKEIDLFYKKFDLSKRNEQIKVWVEDLVLENFKIRYRNTDFKDLMDEIEKGSVDAVTASEQVFERIIKND